jgi:ferric-dicitrate binding protein FerR (iron transport regulator)
MNSTLRMLFLAALLFWPVLVASTDVARSQDGGCNLAQIGGTGRYVVTCRDGLSITAEKGASYQLLDRDRNGVVDAVRLRAKAVLVDVPAERPGRKFQVITPQAIAAVRGTRWAVDVAPAKTSVFVERGEVGVRKRAAGAGVVLGPGEGVDVEAGKPLQVKRWGQPRLNALMQRLGQ